MNKQQLVNTAIGITSLAVQTLILVPWHDKINDKLEQLTESIQRVEQTIKKDKEAKEFKDM
jgi:uncharacterized protein (DUF342 family)